MRLIVTENNNSAKKIAEALSRGANSADKTYKVPFYAWTDENGDEQQDEPRLPPALEPRDPGDRYRQNESAGVIREHGGQRKKRGQPAVASATVVEPGVKMIERGDPQREARRNVMSRRSHPPRGRDRRGGRPATTSGSGSWPAAARPAYRR